MTNRDRALADAQVVADYLDMTGRHEPEVILEHRLRLGLALVYAPADIGERLEEINHWLDAFYTDGIGVG